MNPLLVLIPILILTGCGNNTESYMTNINSFRDGCAGPITGTLTTSFSGQTIGLSCELKSDARVQVGKGKP